MIMVYETTIFSTLSFIVLSSKKCILYNEEILVALCFISFTMFLYKSVAQSLWGILSKRSSSIKSELESFLSTKEKMLIHIIKDDEKHALFHKVLCNVRYISLKSLQIILQERQKTFQCIFCQQIQSLFDFLEHYGVSLNKKIKLTILQHFRDTVLIELKTSKRKFDYSEINIFS